MMLRIMDLQHKPKPPILKNEVLVEESEVGEVPRLLLWREQTWFTQYK